MAWGIECGAGWNELLSSAMAKIQYICDLSTTAGQPFQVIASQIKQKYGTLRFYYDTEGDAPIAGEIIRDIVKTAEVASARTCELTGTPGNLCHRNGWLKTLCRSSATAENYEPCDSSLAEYWAAEEFVACASSVPPSSPPGI